jgi:hypothetical protein
MPLVACCGVELRCQRQCVACHGSSMSERQAYRYLEEASQLDRPVEIPALTVPVTLKLPPQTVELLRKYARSSGLTIGAIVTAALNAFLRTLKRHG